MQKYGLIHYYVSRYGEFYKQWNFDKQNGR